MSKHNRPATILPELCTFPTTIQQHPCQNSTPNSMYKLQPNNDSDNTTSFVCLKFMHIEQPTPIRQGERHRGAHQLSKWPEKLNRGKDPTCPRYSSPSHMRANTNRLRCR